jgi:hypothetical protein
LFPRFGGHEEAALLLILGAFLRNVAIYLKATLGARNRHELLVLRNVWGPSSASR